MKKVLYFVICILAAALMSLTMVYARPLRLHVLANSDSIEDQTVKLAVRDVILRETAAQFDAVLTETQAEDCVRENLDTIVAAADAELRAQGFEYTASAELGQYAFPTRAYSDRIYPAGEYRALRVVLGEGKGKNWWCVLYPPLCTAVVDYENTEVRSFLYDWLKGVFDA
ncbi:MAG: stage II sporulation protein R [Christensenellaceae bacterium]|nr:stage II sporulation protein R [Christensenellaceae bacterium]